MNQFYVSFIFLGIVLIVFSLILILLDKKKVFSFVGKYEEKKKELVDIINDAEQMIEELNKFSDYIVTQMDFKNEELSLNLRKADEQVKNLAQKAHDSFITSEEAQKAAESDFKADQIIGGEIAQETDLVVNGNNNGPVTRYSDTLFNSQKIQAGKSEKVIPLNTRHIEVLRLYKTGLDEIEIARKLNMGKGEVKLILELNRDS